MTFLTSTLAFSQERDVYYLTGFPSDTTANNTTTRWIQTMNNHATRSSINPVAFGYTNADGLQVGAVSAASNMTGTNPTSQAIGIGSSFGGTVLRQIDANGGAPFGGFITVGSPNKGTILAQTVNDDPEKITNTIQSWIEDLIAGPTKSLQELASLSIRGEFIIDETLSFITEKIPFPGGQSIGEMVNNPTQSIIDLNPNSNAMISLNNFNTNLPFVQITIEEDEPQSLFRMIGSDKAHEAPLGQFDDSKVVEIVDIAAGIYEAMKFNYIFQDDIVNLFGFVLFALNGEDPFSFPEARADAWARGQEALESNIESDWQQLVGGTEIVTTYTTEIGGCELNEEELGNCALFTGDYLPGACLACEEGLANTTYTQTFTTYETLPNDSYIPVPNQVFDETGAKIEVLGCNHNEMVNHPGVIAAFESVFNEGSIVDDFFESAP